MRMTRIQSIPETNSSSNDMTAAMETFSGLGFELRVRASVRECESCQRRSRLTGAKQHCVYRSALRGNCASSIARKNHQSRHDRQGEAPPTLSSYTAHEDKHHRDISKEQGNLHLQGKHRGQHTGQEHIAMRNYGRHRNAGCLQSRSSTSFAPRPSSSFSTSFPSLFRLSHLIHARSKILVMRIVLLVPKFNPFPI